MAANYPHYLRVSLIKASTIQVASSLELLHCGTHYRNNASLTTTGLQSRHVETPVLTRSPVTNIETGAISSDVWVV